ncbi:endonuclease/exonuclease/phosphatase family protein [Halosolutus gelatinilyticus]|uniref:endonuclease/exonuclease/phosphatase family protein n=1 Tax=Halosolutus gelatinilyticus TaxID=2931975 RepID=UPI001FF4F779|nr:endonuclease/exonuclease/phosphatase family protein [Halosolutus gelatinilyticus]
MPPTDTAATRTRRGALSALGASGIALASGLCVGSASAEPQAPDRSLTAMSYNVHHGVGSDGRLDLEGTAREIRESGAEVVGLQEVDVHWGERSNFRNQAASLAEMLDANYVFAPIYSLDPPETDRPRREYGLAVLSEYPIRHSRNHEITRLSPLLGPEPQSAPGFPEVSVNVRGVRVSFFATHLDYRADPSVREMQVGDMLEIVDADRGPTLLVGDLNAPPGAPELRPLWDEFDDAWNVRSEEPGYTFPAETPTKRIDYVLTSSDVETDAVEVVETLVSDHRPVIAELSIPGSAVGEQSRE